MSQSCWQRGAAVNRTGHGWSTLYQLRKAILQTNVQSVQYARVTLQEHGPTGRKHGIAWFFGIKPEDEDSELMGVEQKSAVTMPDLGA